jgi:hypothetical protein
MILDNWTSYSNPQKQIALSVVCALVGCVLIAGFRGATAANSNSYAGFYLGVLLLFIGVASFLVSGKQKVVIYPRTRLIEIEDINYLGTKNRTISFSDIDEINIGYLGKQSNFVTYYYLALKLKSGETYPLFAPGLFYEGGSDRPTVVKWQQRLQDQINHS